MEYILMMLVLVGALVFVGYPLANPRRYSARTFVTLGDASTGSALSQQYEQLASAREQTFDALRDFEFDHATGKLSSADYQSLRARYETRAAGVLQQLDALAASAGSGERTGRARRPKPERLAKTGGVARATQPAQGAARVCPRCQTRAAQGDRFCKACGGALPEVTP